jgi:hypothetical protein
VGIGGIMPDEVNGNIHVEEPFLEINTNEKNGSYFSGSVMIITLILIIVITGFFVFYKFRTDSIAKDKEQYLLNILTELNVEENSAIEKKVANINSALEILTIASKSKYSFNDFIVELTKKITNDTKLNSLSISDSGVLTMDGVSSTYRNVADLAVSLESSEKLENVQISGLTGNLEEQDNQVSFSMTADIKDWKVYVEQTDKIGGINE